MKIYTILFLALFGTYFTSFAQKNGGGKERADADLKALHNGYLFFQLFDREDTKNSIRNHLGEKAVQQYEAEEKEKQDNLMKAFRENYTFSKVLFFYSHDKEKIKNNDFSSVKFYTDSNQLVSNDTIDFSHFFIGEVSRIEIDSSIYTDEKGVEHKTPNYSFSALIVRDRNFVQLGNPFPYYVRTMEGMPLLQKKSYRLIASFQNKLERKLKD
ncbi:MAG: hypothetical protein ABI207_06630 [Crocinitomicaceae bacterium]